MAYQSYTLKYRPQTFADIVGQEHVSRTLRNALTAGKVHHAYLFTGPRGTGKTTTARVLARALNCLHGPTPDPCGRCDACVAIGEGRAMDIIEIDAASNRGIDDIRELREKVKYSPAEHRCKLYILDEVHMLTTEAFNALLKTLEEPPPHAFFALLTTEIHRVPPTILSRCQRFEFRPISQPDMVGALRKLASAEGLQVTDEALGAVARASEGAMRDAQSIFEQVVAFSEGEVDLEVVNQVLGVTEAELLAEIADVIARRDLSGAFAVVDRVVSQGKDLGRLVEDLTTFFRDLLRLAMGSSTEAWLALGPDGEQRMRKLADSLGPERLLDVIQALGELRTKLKDSTQHALLLELALVGLCTLPSARASARPAPETAAAAPPSQQTVRESPAEAAATEPKVTPPPSSATAAATPPDPSPTATTPPGSGAATVSTPPAASGTLTCQAIWEQWDALGSQLRRQGLIPAGAFLKSAMPTDFDGQRVVISFPPTHSYHYDSVRSKYAKEIREALQQVLGCPLEVEYRLCQSADEMKTGPPPSQAATAEAGKAEASTSPETVAAATPENEAVTPPAGGVRAVAEAPPAAAPAPTAGQAAPSEAPGAAEAKAQGSEPTEPAEAVAPSVTDTVPADAAEAVAPVSGEKVTPGGVPKVSEKGAADEFAADAPPLAAYDGLAERDDEVTEPRWSDGVGEEAGGEIVESAKSPAEPGGLSADQAVAQALTLFDGAEEIEPDKPAQ